MLECEPWGLRAIAGYPFKRLFDVSLAISTLLALSPMMLIIAALVWATLGRPLFFKHVRAGYKGKPYAIHKFRTMLDTRDAQGNLLPDLERMSWFGNLLRHSSLDELPGLFNVLRGEMSIVGPRPLLVTYVERYTVEHRRRLDVLPGITGWAQVHGRNSTTWEDRFARDSWYVDHCSIWLDIRILLKTVGTLFRGGGGIGEAWRMGEYMGPTAPPNRSGTLSR